MLQSDGAGVLSFPVIDIQPVSGDAGLRGQLQRIADYELLLFVSRNAVDSAFALIDSSQLAAHTMFGVIGSATRGALADALAGSKCNIDDCLVASEPYNSEALLESDVLQRVSGKRILILRGQEGRNLLGDELSRRGAVVEYAEVYRRVLPKVDPLVFNRLVADAFPSLVILTSTEGMHNLVQLVDAGAAKALCRTPWLLISERMRESALKLGHNAPVLVARNASDSGIRQTICAWADRQ
jgi:uroporphyrinogen-III synthase